MWGKEREKLSKSIATGVTILVFLLLLVQFVFFGVKVVENYRVRKYAEWYAANEVEKEIQRSVDINTGEVKPISSATKSSASKYVSKSVSKPVSKPVSSPAKGYKETSKVDLKPLYKRADKPLKYEVKPLIDLNSADSSTLVSLYGIGPYYAKKIIEYREKLGGFVTMGQLLEIWGMDSTRVYGFADKVFLDSTKVRQIDFYTISYDSLAAHPYIGKYAAKGIDRYRKIVKREEFSISTLIENSIISQEQGTALQYYVRK